MVRCIRRTRAGGLAPLVTLVACVWALTGSPAVAVNADYAANFSPCHPSGSFRQVKNSSGNVVTKQTYKLTFTVSATCGKTSYDAQASDVILTVAIDGLTGHCRTGNGHLGPTYSIGAPTCTIPTALPGVYTVTIHMEMWPHDNPVPADCEQYPPGYNTQYCDKSWKNVVPG